MNPDLAAAVRDLEADGVLAGPLARRLGRVARGELLSVHHELRLVLYLGVLLTVAGVGLLVQQNLERLGPLTVAVGIGLAAGGCLAWAARRLPPFSWSQASSPDLAFDYVLLLGVLLAAADLAYVEARFTPLGPGWPWHLLIVSLFMAAVAVRADSRVVLSLALSTFAAWRGVSASLLERGPWSGGQETVRVNAAACGILFVLLGALALHTRRKPHFEPVLVHFGWLLILAALLLDAGKGAEALLLAAVGAGLAWWAYRRRRFGLFAMGLLAAYVGVTSRVLDVLGGVDVLVFGWFVLSAIALLAALIAVHGRTRGEK